MINIKKLALALPIVTIFAANPMAVVNAAETIPGYAYTVDKNTGEAVVARNAYEECWKSGDWTPEMAIPACSDVDNDGVRDDKDLCTETPEGAEVDENGLSDQDNDGVRGICAGQDACPDTPVPPPVGADGCYLPEPAGEVGYILFDFDKSDIRSDAAATLDGLMEELEGKSIVINGYADTTGAADYNQGLSQRRAEAVRSYLLSKGLSADMVAVAGNGETDEFGDKAENRRGVVVVE